LRFLAKIEIFHKNWDFWPKLRFLTKIEICDQNWDFWRKLWFLTQKFRVLTIIAIFHQNCDSCSKLTLWTKITIVYQYCDFSLNFRFLTKIAIFPQNWLFWPNLISRTKIETFENDFWSKFLRFAYPENYNYLPNTYGLFWNM